MAFFQFRLSRRDQRTLPERYARTDHGQFLLMIVTQIVFAFVPLFSQTNLIVNGNFEGDSGWNDLGQYNGGQASSKVESNAYQIDISSPGSEVWSIQFTQTHITLDSGAIYTLSFQLSSSIERTIEVSLSRNGGDYVSYSGRDTLSINPKRQLFERTFVMKHATDTDVRLEFNCGKNTGLVAIREVRLEKVVQPIIQIATPPASELLFEGVPYAITWQGHGVVGAVRIELSKDNGSTWRSIDSSVENSGSFIWTPDQDVSAWCLIRISSVENPSASALNEGAFEIAPRRELIRNGTFSLESAGWNFDVSEGKAEGEISPEGLYHISIEKSGGDFRKIQLIQSGITLEEGQTYRFSFLAHADEPTVIQVNVCGNADPFTRYSDSAEGTIELTSGPTRYTSLFTMREPGDSNSRIELNCGLSSGDLYFDEVSLLPEYKAPVRCVTRISRNNGSRKPVFLHPGSLTSFSQSGRRHRIYDLKGRRIPVFKGPASRKSPIHSKQEKRTPGVYLIEFNEGNGIE